nr:zinc ribbon domain-containing protein [uncultured Desulfuromonas sp.]
MRFSTTITERIVRTDFCRVALIYPIKKLASIETAAYFEKKIEKGRETMPIYENRCQKCGKITEKLARSSEKEMICPACSGVAERILSVFSSPTTSQSSGNCLPGSGFS